MCLGGSPSHQEKGGVAKQEKASKPAKNQPSPSHSQCKLEIQTLRQDLKVCSIAMIIAPLFNDLTLLLFFFLIDTATCNDEGQGTLQ